jgi:hypothetical protein
MVWLQSGDAVKALGLSEEVLSWYRRHGVLEGVGFAVLNRGFASLELGDADGGTSRLRGGARILRGVRPRRATRACAPGCAAIAGAAGNQVDAARLLGRANTALARAAWRLGGQAGTVARRVEVAARDALGDAFEVEYGAGRESAG